MTLTKFTRVLSNRLGALAQEGRFKMAQYLNPKAHAVPDFIIPGFQRCGTSSLYRYLGLHPQIVRARRKEIHYFDKDDNYARGENWYRAHFPTWKTLEQVGQPYGCRALTGEATPAYIFRDFAAKRMAQFIAPEVRLIVIMRNPVERAYSNYCNGLRKGGASLSFEEYLDCEFRELTGANPQPLSGKTALDKEKDYLKRGIYVDQLIRLKELCPKNPLLLLRAEDMFKDANGIANQAAEFLGLPPFQLEDTRNLSKLKYEPMKPATRQRLAEFFKPHNERLYAHVGRDFGWK
jgi:hypothetical protein